MLALQRALHWCWRRRVEVRTEKKGPYVQDRDAGEAAGLCQRVRDDAAALAAGGVPDDRAAARAHTQQADALLRLVLHRLEREGGNVARLEGHTALHDAATKGAGAAARASGVSATGEGFTWLGEDFPVENSAAQGKLDEGMAKLHEARSAFEAAGGDGAPQERISGLQTAFAPYDAAIECMVAASASLEEAGEVSGPEEQALRSAVAVAIEETRIERFSVQAIQVRLPSKSTAGACMYVHGCK